MEKLMTALVALAEAGTRYLDAKTAQAKIVSGAPVVVNNLGAVPPTAPDQVPAPAAKEPKKAKAAKAAPAPAPTPAPQAPAPAQEEDPLGDTGPTSPALGGQQVPPEALGDDKGGGAQEAIKVLTEAESYEKMIKTMGAFVQLCKNDTPDGLAQNRALLAEKFKVAKIKDLTHPQRVEMIAAVEALIAAKGAK